MRAKNHAYEKRNHAYKTHGLKPCVLSKRYVFLVLPPRGANYILIELYLVLQFNQ